MRYLYIVFMLLTASCLRVGENPPLQKACTLMATAQQYRVDLGANASLPAFLAVTDGSGNPLADECNTNPVYSPVIHRFQDHAFYVDGAPLVNDNFDDIDESYKPNLKLYGRASCGDAPVLVGQNAAVELTWIPQYGNGADCGSSGSVGEGDL